MPTADCRRRIISREYPRSPLIVAGQEPDAGAGTAAPITKLPFGSDVPDIGA
jgi:hypothetical protein